MRTRRTVQGSWPTCPRFADKPWSPVGGGGADGGSVMPDMPGCLPCWRCPLPDGGGEPPWKRVMPDMADVREIPRRPAVLASHGGSVARHARHAPERWLPIAETGVESARERTPMTPGRRSVGRGHGAGVRIGTGADPIRSRLWKCRSGSSGVAVGRRPAHRRGRRPSCSISFRFVPSCVRFTESIRILPSGHDAERNHQE